MTSPQPHLSRTDTKPATRSCSCVAAGEVHRRLAPRSPAPRRVAAAVPGCGMLQGPPRAVARHGALLHPTWNPSEGWPLFQKPHWAGRACSRSVSLAGGFSPHVHFLSPAQPSCHLGLCFQPPGSMNSDGSQATVSKCHGTARSPRIYWAGGPGSFSSAIL